MYKRINLNIGLMVVGFIFIMAIGVVLDEFIFVLKSKKVTAEIIDYKSEVRKSHLEYFPILRYNDGLSTKQIVYKYSKEPRLLPIGSKVNILVHPILEAQFINFNDQWGWSKIVIFGASFYLLIAVYMHLLERKIRSKIRLLKSKGIKDYCNVKALVRGGNCSRITVENPILRDALLSSEWYWKHMTELENQKVAVYSLPQKPKLFYNDKVSI